MGKISILLFWLGVLLIIKGPDVVRYCIRINPRFAEFVKRFGFNQGSSRNSSSFWTIFGSPGGVFRHTAHFNSQGIFFTSLFSMCGKLAKADGFVDAREIEIMEHFIDDRLQLSPHRKRMAIDIFRRAKDSTRPFQSFAEEFARTFRHEPQVTRLMYELLLELAQADGAFTPEEMRLLGDAETIFGLKGGRGFYSSRSWQYSSGDHQSRSGSRPEWDQESRAPEGSPYSVLGLPEGATLLEVKKRYRKLVLECHPDRLIARGVPEELRKTAEQRFKEIQQAYETISKGA